MRFLSLRIAARAQRCVHALRATLCSAVLMLIGTWAAASDLEPTPQAPLTFEAALAEAEQFAPELAAARARIDSADAELTPSDALPDPELMLGIDNLPIDGNEALNVGRDFMTMRRIGLRQAIPAGDKRASSRERALATQLFARAQAEQSRAALRQQVADAWLMRAGVEAQLDVLQRYAAQIDQLDAAARAAIVAGDGALTGILLPGEARAEFAGRRDALEAERAAGIARLRRWLGAAADAALAGAAPLFAVDATLLRAHVDRHPELAAAQAEASIARADLASARAELHPDWDIELAYQQRGPRFSDMLSLQVSVQLPLFAEARQRPRIAARAADAAAIAAEREAMLRAHIAALEADVAEHARLERAATRQRDVLLPLAHTRSGLALTAWRTARGTLIELIAARSAEIDAELLAIALHTQQQRLAARLHFTYEPEPEPPRTPTPSPSPTPTRAATPTDTTSPRDEPQQVEMQQ